MKNMRKCLAWEEWC